MIIIPIKVEVSAIKTPSASALKIKSIPKTAGINTVVVFPEKTGPNSKAEAVKDKQTNTRAKTFRAFEEYSPNSGNRNAPRTGVKIANSNVLSILIPSLGQSVLIGSIIRKCQNHRKDI